MLLQLNFSAAFSFFSQPTRGHSPLKTTSLLWIAAATLSPPPPASICHCLLTGHHFLLSPTAPAGAGGKKKRKAKAALFCILTLILPDLFRQEQGYVHI